MATNPTPLAPFVQAAWESVLPPISEINKMGTETGEGHPPSTLPSFWTRLYQRKSPNTFLCAAATARWSVEMPQR
jgi:hypothetical protein